MPPAARITDPHACGIPLHGVNVIAGPCCPTVLVGNLLAARVSDLTACAAPIAKGSMTVMIGFLPAARMGDITGHGGVIVKGEPTVMIGDDSGGPGSPKKCVQDAAGGGCALVGGGPEAG